MSDWEDVPLDSGDDWEDVPVEAPAQQDGPSKLSSGLRGAAQGVSGGFQDELEGLLAGAGRTVGLTGFGGNISDIGFNESPTVDWDKISGAYTEARDKQRGVNREAQSANPISYGSGTVAGAIGSNLLLPGLNAAKGASLLKNVGMGAAQGGVAGAGFSDADNLTDLGVDTATGAGFGAGAGVLTKGVESLGAGARRAGSYLKDQADDLYLKATGATGSQLSKFADDAPEVLRDFVKPFDSPGNIADRIGETISKNTAGLDDSIKAADASGAKINLVDYLERAEKRVFELRNQGLGAQADALEAQVHKVVDNANKIGKTEVVPSFMENVKRGEQGSINYGADNINSVAGKRESASMARQAVEDSITDPLAKQKFLDEKRLYGVLAPIEDAAQKRANTLNQSPLGGLGDTAAQAMGMIPGGNALSGLATAAARRAIAPRLASTAAWSADKIADYLQTSPQIFGKYSGVLQQAAQRGPQGVASTHFILESTDSSYRELLRQVADRNTGE